MASDSYFVRYCYMAQCRVDRLSRYFRVYSLLPRGRPVRVLVSMLYWYHYFALAVKMATAFPCIALV